MDKHHASKKASSVWGGNFSSATNSRTSLAKIYQVHPEKRTCDIKTYGSDEMVANADFTDVQWLDVYGSVNGDEISFVPQAGSQCMVIFAEGVPWIIGFIKPTSLDSEEAPTDLEGEGLEAGDVAGGANLNREKANAGDQIFRTAGGARLALRAGGETELESSKICRRMTFPSKSLITDLCQNYEFRTDGGTIDWVDHPDDANKTISTQVWKDDLKATNIVTQVVGTTAINSRVIYSFSIKPGGYSFPGAAIVPNPEVYKKELSNTGKSETKINGTKYVETIDKDGQYTEGINDNKFYHQIKPSGESVTNIANKWQLKVLDSGETTLDVGISGLSAPGQAPSGGKGKFNLKVAPSGETTLTVNQAVASITPSGVIDFKTGGADIKMENSGNVTVKAGAGTVTMESSGNITIKGGASTVTIKSSGEIEVKGVKVTLKAPQIILNNQGSGITTANSHMNVIDLISGAPCIPSPTTYGDI